MAFIRIKVKQSLNYVCVYIYIYIYFFFFTFLRLSLSGTKLEPKLRGRLSFLKLGYNHQIELNVPPVKCTRVKCNLLQNMSLIIESMEKKSLA